MLRSLSICILVPFVFVACVVAAPPEGSRLTTKGEPAIWGLYGGATGNELFQKLSMEFMPVIVNSIRESAAYLKEHGDASLYAVFERHIQLLERKRRQIAFLTNTTTAGRFGQRRDENYEMPTDIATMHLASQYYKHWRERAKENMVAQVGPLLVEPTRVTTEWTVTGETRSRLTILTRSEFWTKNEAEADILNAAVLNRSIDQNKPMLDQFRLMAAVNNLEVCTERDKSKFTEYFKKLDILKFLLCEVEILADGEFIPLTKHMGFFIPDPQTTNGFSPKALESFITDSCLVTMHTYKENVPALLKLCSRWWYEAIFWEGTNVEELMDLVSRVQYLSDNLMLDARGSGTIAEWKAEGIFRYHGYRIEQLPGVTSIVQEDLANPSLPDFQARFRNMVKCMPLEDTRLCKTTSTS
jgi:hypothetical protein